MVVREGRSRHDRTDDYVVLTEELTPLPTQSVTNHDRTQPLTVIQDHAPNPHRARALVLRWQFSQSCFHTAVEFRRPPEANEGVKQQHIGPPGLSRIGKQRS